MDVVKKLQPITVLPKKQYPVRVLQFGTGNFLRGFADWMIQKANDRIGLNMGVTMVQSMSNQDTLIKQNGSYTVYIRGLQDGLDTTQIDKVDVVQRIVNGQDLSALESEALNPHLEIILSNTTETGITFDSTDASIRQVAKTFPGKLTQVLFKRMQAYPEKQLAIIPCELIEKNGSVLEQCVINYASHWHLGAEFEQYVQTKLHFCQTLVDRIVPGIPKNPKQFWDDIGYEDNALVMCEPYHLWAIEAPLWVQKLFPLNKADLKVIYTHDLEPYRIRKVRMLNGMHSIMAPIGYLAGVETVREAMEHKTIGSFVRNTLEKEILPFIPGDYKVNKQYSNEVIQRFLNPAINHQLIDITLYSFSKFKVRLLPSLKLFEQTHGLSGRGLAFAMASLLFLYRGIKEGMEIPLKDDPYVIKLMRERWKNTNFTETGFRQLAETVLQDKTLWNQDLTNIHRLVEKVALYLYWIDQFGMITALEKVQNEL